MPGNLPRILPKGLAAIIERGAWEAPPIFSLIQKKGDIDDQEMYRVFNMGICMVVVTAPGDAAMLIREIPGARLIGEVIKQKEGKRVVI